MPPELETKTIVTATTCLSHRLQRNQDGIDLKVSFLLLAFIMLDGGTDTTGR